jgi:hypothetical protein
MFSVSAGYFTKQNTNVKACDLALMAFFFFFCEVSILDAGIVEGLLWFFQGFAL